MHTRLNQMSQNRSDLVPNGFTRVSNPVPIEEFHGGMPPQKSSLQDKLSRRFGGASTSATQDREENLNMPLFPTQNNAARPETILRAQPTTTNFRTEEYRPQQNLTRNAPISSIAGQSIAETLDLSDDLTLSSGRNNTSQSSDLRFSSVRNSIPQSRRTNDEQAVGKKLLEIIRTSNSNFIGILNETSAKARTNVTYSFKDFITSQSTKFECSCNFGNRSIGSGSGASKQVAKAQSAENGLLALLTRSEFASERAILVQTYQNLVPGFRTALSQDNTSDNYSNSRQNADPNGPSDNAENNFMEGSPLYELNYIAKECFVEPRWMMSSCGGPNGGFEVKLVFDQLTVTGSGRKKNDAKQDAALILLKKIKSSRELSEKYNPKLRKNFQAGFNEEPEGWEGEQQEEEYASQNAGSDSRMSMFQSVLLDSRLWNSIQSESLDWIASVSEIEINFTEHLSKVIRVEKIEEEVDQALMDLYNRILDYLNIICAKPRQIMSGAREHMSDYVNNFSLVPIGSFGLNCVREKNLCIDAIFSYKKMKSITEADLLNILYSSLLECKKIVGRNNMGDRLEIALKDLNNKQYISISLCVEAGDLEMHLQVQDLTIQSLSGVSSSFEVTHISRLYSYFGTSNEIEDFRNLMMLLRCWRAKCNLKETFPEILDVVLLNEYIKGKCENIAGYILNCLTIMSSGESLKGVINKFGRPYTMLYQAMSSQAKNALSTKSSKSLENIYKKDYEGSQF